MTTDTKFIAEVRNVKEVLLVASADLAFWQAKLGQEGLFPFNNDGQAELTISATELTWMGRRTNELTVGIAVCARPHADSRDGLFLVHAFTSSRLFAWIERTAFHTPYYYGRIQVRDQLPCSMQLGDASGRLVDIRMTTTPNLNFASEEMWQGTIYLPRGRSAAHRPAPYFVAKLGGATEVYPYVPAASVLDLAPRREHPVFQWLLASNLAGREWHIRHAAVHARSKTTT